MLLLTWFIYFEEEVIVLIFRIKGAMSSPFIAEDDNRLPA